MNKTPDNLYREVDSLNQQQEEILNDLVKSQQQMKQLAKRIWKVQEDERKQIAQELHDSVGQLLTAVINKLEIVKQDKAQLDTEELLELTRQALGETRELSRLMRPRILDDLGLVPALSWLSRIMGEKGPADIQFSHDVGHPLDAEMETLVFRIVQECLTNAIKHSQAKNIQIIVKSTPNILMLKVVDDGVGIDPEMEDGFGLATIRDRVFSFEGQLFISTAPNHGTEIKVIFTSIGAA